MRKLFLLILKAITKPPETRTNEDTLQQFQAGYRWASETYKRKRHCDTIHAHIFMRNDRFGQGARKWLQDNNKPLGDL